MKTVSQVIEDSFENPEPYKTILETLKPYDGKLFNKNVISKLETALPGYHFYLNNNHVYTKLVFWEYSKKEDSWVVSVETKYVKVDIDYIQKSNARDLSALESRNNQRKELLNNKTALNKLEVDIDEYNRCKKALNKVLRSDTFGVVKDTIEREMVNTIW